MSEDLLGEEVRHAIDRVVEELLTAAGVSAPPVDAIALARGHLGLVLERERAPQRPDGRRSPARRRAGGDEPTEEARQWAAAHRIGEHLKAAILRHLGLSPEQGRGLGSTSLATRFASHLLAPLEWFRDDARALDFDVLGLQQRYPTAGAELLAWRLLDLPEPVVITVVDNDHVQRRRSNAWRVRRELGPAERECQRYVHYYSRPRVVCAGGWTVQGWPLHRVDWKREILRSVGPEEE
jgi:hypothetical protein